MNQLRNDLTHNIRFLDFDLKSYVQSLSDKNFARAARTLCTGIVDAPVDLDETNITSAQAKQRRTITIRQVVFQKAPREAIWFSGLFALELLSL